MGGTKILACVVNSKRGIIARVKKATEINKNQAYYVKVLAEIINEVIELAGVSPKSVKAVCLGIPGSVNPFTGRIGLAPNLGLKNFFIKEKLQKLVSIPVLIENDVNLGALGIKRFGYGRKAKNMLVVFVGTGIGGALIIDEKIYRGSNYVAGEIGHMVVDPKGPKCGCGNIGCFEAVASRTAIARNITADIKKGKKSVISKQVKSGQKIKSKALAQGIKSKDKVVVKHIDDACFTIGLVLADITNLLNLDTIILGGGLIEALDYYMLPKIKESFKINVLKDSAHRLKIIETKLGDDAAIFGGIPLAEEFLKIKV